MVETRWSLIARAAGGDGEARETFAQRYQPVVRAYLAARWRGNRSARDLDDAVQETFVDCFREDGALIRARAGGGGGFRAYLFGVVRTVALHFETRHARRVEREEPERFHVETIASADEDLARVFDRAFATAVLREAQDLHAERARAAGDTGLARVELLRLRFEEGLPIRTIAARWSVDAKGVHHQYARARKEFKAALFDVLVEQGVARDEVDSECSRLLELLARDD
jgi:RNA polymerase sigma-70 factor (ECF subfamily)